MKRLVRNVTLALALLALSLGKNADADTIIVSEVHNIALNGADAVAYTFFTVTSAGVFDITADGPPAYTLADPQIYLFTDNGSPGGALTGSFIAMDDDSGPGMNSLINDQFLNAGNYVIAVGAFFLSENSARSDSNADGCCSGTVLVTVSQVPEPGTFLLFGFGLLALRFIVRRA